MKNHISFSKNERNGLMLLFIILIGFSVYQIMFFQDDDLLKAPIRLQKIENAVLALEQERSEESNHNQFVDNEKEEHTIPDLPPEKISKAKFREKEVERFLFDPNTATYDTLLRLGFTKYAAKNLLKYREKGGRINDASGLKRIYGISEKDFHALQSFVEVVPLKKNVQRSSEEVAIAEEKKSESENEAREVRKFTPINITLDINQASEEEWQKLYGIGPAFAARIVKYRSGLGGFHSVSQLKEVYGFPDSTFQNIKDQVVLADSFEVKKIALNKVDYDTLKGHYYVDYNLASILINYRTQHGSYASIEDLQKIKIITPEFLEKIGPYLDFSQ